MTVFKEVDTHYHGQEHHTIEKPNNRLGAGNLRSTLEWKDDSLATLKIVIMEIGPGVAIDRERGGVWKPVFLNAAQTELK